LYLSEVRDNMNYRHTEGVFLATQFLNPFPSTVQIQHQSNFQNLWVVY